MKQYSARPGSGRLLLMPPVTLSPAPRQVLVLVATAVLLVSKGWQSAILATITVVMVLAVVLMQEAIAIYLPVPVVTPRLTPVLVPVIPVVELVVALVPMEAALIPATLIMKIVTFHLPMVANAEDQLIVVVGRLDYTVVIFVMAQVVEFAMLVRVLLKIAQPKLPMIQMVAIILILVVI